MGTIVRLLIKHSNILQPHSISSFNNLHKSTANLEVKYLVTEAYKDMLLNTRNSAKAERRKLKIDIKTIDYGTCENLSCARKIIMPLCAIAIVLNAKIAQGSWTRNCVICCVIMG